MNLVAPFRIRIEKDVVTKVPRNLKGKGTINVAIGQQVSPTDILGTAFISSGFRIIQLAQQLKVSPQEVGKYLKKNIGDKVYKDELIAEKNDGLLGGKKVIISPTDGIVDFINPQTGDLKITFLPKKIDLPAGVFGEVLEIEKNKNQIWIKTQASIIHGVFGTGRMRDGILKVISKREDLLTNSFISSNGLSGYILLGGSLIYKDAISASISDGVSGIITGGINAKDYKGMAGGRLIFPKKLDTDIGISVVVCEGFGSIPLGEDIYDFLSKHEGRFILIDGNAGQVFLPSFDPSSMIKIRKTTLAPQTQEKLLTTSTQFEGQSLELKLGMKVRVMGNSYAGEQGKIIALNKTETILVSSVRAFLATIETKRHKIQVPVANLEVIDYSL